MKKLAFVLFIVIGVFAISCNSNQKYEADEIKEEIVAKEFTSIHVFTAKFEGVEFHECMGLTALCPDQCGHSGNMANFKVIDYKDFVVNGEAGTEKLEDYHVLISDYYKNDLDKDYVPFIKSLNPSDEVEIHLEYVYDTSLDEIQTIENIISIIKIR
ncbi:MAG: hypothetical protein GX879_04410 [Bacteroidales bacterium]|nr:hypothetical protein [Bacteroidales bacterium]